MTLSSMSKGSHSLRNGGGASNLKPIKGDDKSCATRETVGVSGTETSGLSKGI